MKVTVSYEEGLRFQVQARAHQITIDQSHDKGGSDQGMNPLEVFLTSLGSCVAVYAHKYCAGAKVNARGLRVEVEASLTNEAPYRFSDIQIEVKVPEVLKDRKDAFLRFVKNCPIHSTIKGQPRVDISVSS